MRTVGIICEYNPFHNGHLRQLRLAREMAGEDCALVCLMSGNYVQRGEPALFPKGLRAEATVRCGADLVLELPLTVALTSAEGFAAGGVAILSALGCDFLCFGTETGDLDALRRTAAANLDPAFDSQVRAELESGCSYASARQRALETLGAGAGLSTPNDILAVEYLKALLRRNSPMTPLPIQRPDTYHAASLDPEAPSASALRRVLTMPSPWGEGAEQSEADEGVRRTASGIWSRADGCVSTSSAPVCALGHLPLKGKALEPCVQPWRRAVPEALHALYESAPIHTWQAGERAALAILRTLPDEAFAVLPFGSEGLWSKLMKASRSCASTAEIIEATKSKRYSYSRVQRMLLCAVLGLSRADLETPPPYVRILGFNQKGRTLLREMKSRFPLVNAGQRPADAAYYALERRAADLYSLFSDAGPRPAGEEDRLRVTFLKAK